MLVASHKDCPDNLANINQEAWGRNSHRPGVQYKLEGNSLKSVKIGKIRLIKIKVNKEAWLNKNNKHTKQNNTKQKEALVQNKGVLLRCN